MKKIRVLLLSLAFLLTSFSGKAQIICATSHGVNKIYTNIDTAILYADSGSILYFSGGTFAIAGPNADSLNKPINLVGAGYWPDSTAVTGPTIISGSNYLSLSKLSSNSSFTGIDFRITISTNNTGNINNVIFSRCIFDVASSNGYAFGGGGTNTNSFTFSECIFNADPSSGNFGGTPNASAIFDRCLFFNAVSGWQLSTSFTHCTFFMNGKCDLCGGGMSFSGMDNCTFQNSVFLNCNLPGSFQCNDNTFQNCITNDSALLAGNSSINVNTILRADSSNFFVTGTFPFSYTSDYNLLTICPGHNYATDGTDCGVYGTTKPFKPGAVPYNPHFSLNNIAPATNANGELNLNIIVGAQSR